MDWKQLYSSQHAPFETIISQIRENDVMVTPCCCGEPCGLVKLFLENYESFKNVEIVSMMLLKGTPWVKKEYKGHFKYRSFYASPSSREELSNGYAHFNTCHFHEIPGVLKDVIKPRVGIYTVSPPDEDGFVSLGTSVDYIESTIEYCEVKIAQVNKYMPYTYGSSRKHISEFTYFVDIDEPLPVAASTAITDVELKIGEHCAELVNDGDCVQLGIGSIPDAVCLALKNKKNLGLHTEMIGDGSVDLLKSGAVTNVYKNIYKGKTVLSFALGTTKLFDFINNNKDLEFRPIWEVNDPFVIAKNDNVTSINSCLEIDLTGQIAADSIGPVQYSGVGGQVDFIRGASGSKGGKSVIAMPSTAKKGTVSRIVPKLSDFSAVTTTRNDVQYIVTEYGTANLRGLSLYERGEALIKIAHPDFRDELKKELDKRFYNFND